MALCTLCWVEESSCQVPGGDPRWTMHGLWYDTPEQVSRLSVALGRLSVALWPLLLRITASITGIGHGGPYSEGWRQLGAKPR